MLIIPLEKQVCTLEKYNLRIKVPQGRKKTLRSNVECLVFDDDEYLIGYPLKGVRDRMIDSEKYREATIASKYFKKGYNPEVVITMTKISIWPHKKR